MKNCLKYLALFFCLAVIDAVQFRCDYKYYGIGWFKYNETPMTWDNARSYCRLQGAMLASPTTVRITDIMKELMVTRDIFTGIHSTYTEGQFYSLDGIPLFSMPHIWADSEPDNKYGKEKCVALNAGGYISDVKCEDSKPFICYRENSSIDVNSCGTLDSGYQLDGRTNKCYKFHEKAKKFDQASFICSAEGGHLAIVNSEEESKVMSEIFARYPSKTITGYFWKEHAFIGFHYWNKNNDWMTVHDQSLQEAGFSTFAKGEPNNAHGGEACGSIDRNGLLNDLKCEYTHMFICEKDPNVPSVCDASDEKYESTNSVYDYVVNN